MEDSGVYSGYSLADIDTEALIEQVRIRPALWDKSLGETREYINRGWADVCLTMNPEFDTMSDLERNRFGQLITKRWKNVKDQYIKTMKRNKKARDIGGKLRSYVYQDALSFYAKAMRFKESRAGCGTISDGEMVDYDDMNLFAVTKEEDLSSDPVVLLPHESSSSGSSSSMRAPPRFGSGTTHNGHIEDYHVSFKAPHAKKKKMSAYKKRQRLVAQKLQEQVHGPVVTEERHASFFKGLLPSLRTFNEDETLAFQSGVINVIQNIRKSRSPGTAALLSSLSSLSSSSSSLASSVAPIIDLTSPMTPTTTTTPQSTTKKTTTTNNSTGDSPTTITIPDITGDSSSTTTGISSSTLSSLAHKVQARVGTITSATTNNTTTTNIGSTTTTTATTTINGCGTSSDSIGSCVQPPAPTVYSSVLWTPPSVHCLAKQETADAVANIITAAAALDSDNMSADGEDDADDTISFSQAR